MRERRKHINYRTFIDDSAQFTLEQAAIFVQGQAMLLAPVDTGNLRNSVQRKMVSDDVAEVWTDVEYAVYQEFGTRHQPGTPFMRPAAGLLRSRLQDQFNQGMRRNRRVLPIR